MVEEAFAALVKHAESHGLKVFFHNEQGMPFLMVRERREVYMSSALPFQRRISLLEKALEQASIPRPTHGWSCSPAHAFNSKLVDSLVGDCDSTLRETTPPSEVSVRESAAESVQAARVALSEGSSSPDGRHRPLGPIGADRCEVCGDGPYGFIKGLTFCRYHLGKSVIGALEPSEVMQLRRRHGHHPEISSERYDERGRAR